MQVAVRSYLTAGVATVGAGVIALSPIAPSMPAVHLPSVQQAEVALSAQVGPIEAWVQVVQAAVANLQDLGSQLQADPAPILQQVIKNQTADFNLVGSAVQESVKALNTALQAAPATLRAAQKQLAAGNVVGATNTLLAPLLSNLLAIVIQPITDGFPAITNPMQNLTNFVAEIPAALTNIGVPVLNPLYSVIDATASVVQTVIDNVPAVAFNAMINAPATLTGALLNGFGPGPLGLGAGGLLTAFEGQLGSFTAGPIGALIAIRDAFAKAITPPKAPSAATTQHAALNAAASLPAGGTTVTLSTHASLAKPAVKVATPAAKVAPAATTGSAAAAPASTSTTTTTTTNKHHTQGANAAGKNAGGSASAGKTHRTTGHSAGK
jgi:hypothetical protein